MHERGLAIDFTPASGYAWLSRNASKYGLHVLASGGEPWHYSTTGG